MWKRFGGLPLLVAVIAWNSASCNRAARNGATPTAEAEQVISESMKDLYMAASAAAARSAQQQSVIAQMAEQASNGKELLLTLRAGLGVFPGGPESESRENQIRSKVARKMMEMGTLGQLIEYASQYSVNPEDSRPLVQRMLELGGREPDARIWYRIRAAAYRLKVADLGQQAQAKADELARN